MSVLVLFASLGLVVMFCNASRKTDAFFLQGKVRRSAGKRSRGGKDELGRIRDCIFKWMADSFIRIILSSGKLLQFDDYKRLLIFSISRRKSPPTATAQECRQDAG
jgi:hypothetical protein